MEGEALAWALLWREDQAGGGGRPISGDRTWGTIAEVGMSVAVLRTVRGPQGGGVGPVIQRAG